MSGLNLTYNDEDLATYSVSEYLLSLPSKNSRQSYASNLYNYFRFLNPNTLPKRRLRGKKGESGRKLQPFDIATQNPGMDFVFKWLEYRRAEVGGDETQLAFPMSSWQAQNAVKKNRYRWVPTFFQV